MSENTPPTNRHFIEDIIDEDNKSGKWDGRVHTRFPPEPNGFLHIGHAKSICLNFGLADQYGGKCNLRFDDTNPVKEEQLYIDAAIADIRWLGVDWEDRLFFASDYFETMYGYAVELIEKGRAYVCDLSLDEIRNYRGTITAPGTNSPYRDRDPGESVDLFKRMRAGEFPDGSRTLRARIDMASPNLHLRDPVMYRILHASHPRTGAEWCVYPMYDWAHGLEDSIEGITHSICTLEFEIHRPLYDWFIDAINEHRDARIHHPQQIEFARLALNYTVMSKRKLLELVQKDHVAGWDDPRMPTLSGMRRRGYTAASIRTFCSRIGVARFKSTIDVAKLEHCVREDLNKTSPRVMAVLDPLKLVIENYPEDQQEQLDAINNPEDPSAGARQVPFSRNLYIERNDFLEDPPRKFFRLAPGREVRLRYAYFVTCREVIKDDNGNIAEVRCTYDPETRGGDAPDGRKVKATLHWVGADHALDAEVRLYDRLFTRENPTEVEDAHTDEANAVDLIDSEQDLSGSDAATAKDWKSNLNPDSLRVSDACKIEPSVRGTAPGTRFQFERQGYYCVDPDSTPDHLVFNRTVTLKDSWAKIQKKQQGGKS